jgi:hypothetical protein
MAKKVGKHSYFLINDAQLHINAEIDFENDCFFANEFQTKRHDMQSSF